MKRLLFFSFQLIGLVLVAQTQFGPKVLLDATLHTQDIETIDVNNDGFQDIIVSESLYFSQPRRISMSLNSGNGSMGSLTTIATLNSTRCFIAKGDLNNDGWQDLVSYDDQGVFILLNNTDNTFSKISVDTTVLNAGDIEVADMNNDNLDDIIVAHEPTLSVFYNQSNLIFLQETISNPNPTEIYTIEIADLYNDGFPEIVEGAFPYYVYDNNNGQITYDATASNLNTTGAVFAVSIGDVNNDGLLDIVTNSAALNELLWFENFGNGIFSTKHIIDSNVAQINDIDMADIDGDGKTDVITTYNQTGEIVWYKNTGTNSLGSKNVVSTGIVPLTTQVHLADLNNDNLTDIVWANDLNYALNQSSLSSSTFKKDTIKIYPNPSDHFFSIDSKDQGYYSIYNQIGQLIKTGEISTGVNLIQHTLSSGVYSISINSEQNKTLKKLVVR